MALNPMIRAETGPIATMKSTRPDIWRGITSANPGVLQPIAFIPLLREDRVRANCTVQVTSEETLEVIVNPVRVRVEAYLLPKTILERFQGSLEVLNRSYEDEPAPPGMGTTPKWFMPSGPLPAGDKGVELLDRLGIHYKAATVANTDLVEYYNQLVNWMRAERSPSLPKADLANTTCLPAFWDSSKTMWIKPSFDVGQMEGIVPVDLAGQLQVVAGQIGTVPGSTPGLARQADLSLRADLDASSAAAGFKNPIYYAQDVDGTTAGLMGELKDGSGTISLANINMAEQARGFAALRDRYKSVPSEYLIDLLMAGIRIPDADLRQPIPLAMAEAVIGQTKRYATDGADLSVSVANGVAAVSFTINTPPVNPGGMVMVLLSIVPEQLYERFTDTALGYTDGTRQDVATPDYVPDYLDPQKVEVVNNRYVDELHGDPQGIFGYAPLNYRWRRDFARVGGKFKRPVPDTFVEDRQRIWSVEVGDPSLNSDFIMCPTPFPKTVFADTDVDPYEVITVVQASIVGNTVFGPAFEEDLGSYDAIIAAVDKGRIESIPATMTAVDDAVVVETETDA